MKSTQEVLESHLHSFGQGDLDGILSDYAPDAILFTQGGPLKGRDAIQSLFVAMLSEFSKPGARFSLSQQSIEGDYAYIVWTAETADNIYELVTDTFHVRGGKIAVQSFAAKTAPKATNDGGVMRVGLREAPRH